MSRVRRPLGVAGRRVVGASVVAMALIVSWQITERGSAPGADEGAIAVREASLRPRPGALLLDARADIELSPEIRAGLDNGVPLEFVLELSLSEPRALLPDSRLLEVTRRYELTYYELTRHYRVRSFENGGGRNYRSLPAALDGLGTLRGVTLGKESETALLESVDVLDAELELRLDQRALPLPLQSLVGAAWRLDSGRHAWRWSPSAEARS